MSLTPVTQIRNLCLILWGKFEETLKKITRVPTTTASSATTAALRLYGVKRLGILSPHLPMFEEHYIRFFVCLHVTLARRLHALAPGLTPRSVLEKFAAVQMIDVHLPTTDGRELLLTRYTEPELGLLLEKLKLELPA
jgi:hypothetical protein